MVFFKKGKNCYFNMMVSYAGATSYLNDEPAQLYKKFANLKRRHYKERVERVEDGDFVPLIMLSSGSICALKSLCRDIAEGGSADTQTLPLSHVPVSRSL